MAYCALCFNVGTEDSGLQEGDKGIGGCIYYSSGMTVYKDPNFFGTVEATGEKSFRFLPKEKNDWNFDGNGPFGFSSGITWKKKTNETLDETETLTMTFIS